MGTDTVPLAPQTHDEVWIEIVHKVEQLYAELARTMEEMERKNEALLRAKTFTENVLQNMANALAVTDGHGRIQMVNRSCLELLGYREEELVGKPAEVLWDAGCPHKLRPGSPLWKQMTSSGSVRNMEVTYRGRDGHPVPVSFSGTVLADPLGELTGVICIAEDLRPTKRLLEAERQRSQELEQANRDLRDLQNQLIHSEKMRSLGQMAAGVAHEINNPLNGIMVFSHLLLEDTPEGDPRRQNLAKIAREAERCKKIVRDLLDFARPRQGQMHPVDLNAALHSTLSMVTSQPLFQGVELDLQLAPSLPVLNGDAGQLQQVFVNIILNAAESMNGRGRLEIRSESDPRTGEAVLSFSDTGSGIPAKDLARIFEPFFTTKQESHGTGLGLAITHSIVERHGGNISIQSEEGRGTCVRLRFPPKAAGDRL